ncbi:MAG: hypothetical protein AMS16_00120, partial [Planctomycetes bacterium DG_58]
MADLIPPDPPGLRPVGELSGYSTVFSGQAEPGSNVEILLDGRIVTRCQTDETGKFATARLRLTPGTHVLAAKAIDPAGNESVLSERVKLSVSPTPPKNVKSVRWLGNVEARHGDRFLIELIGEDASDRVDHTLVSVASEADPKGIEVELTETGPRTGIFVGLVTVGDVSSFEVPSVRAARHKAKITVVSSVDRAKKAELTYVDDLPPSTPRINCSAYPMLVLNTFEEQSKQKALGEWRTLEGKFGASLSLGESEDNRFLKLTRQQWRSHMGAVAVSRAFDTTEWPLVSLDCKIPSGMRIDVLIRLAELGTLTVRLTGEKPFHPLLGDAVGVKADSKWRHVLVPVHSMLSRRFPKRKSFQVERIEFGSWTQKAEYRQDYGANGPAGAWMGIDNFAVFAHKNLQTVAFTWKSDDPNGIAGDSTVFDCLPNTIPPTEARVPTSGTYRLTEPGRYYLHVRSADRCGNWSRTARYMILCDLEPPAVGKMQVEQAAGNPILNVPLKDAGVGIDPGSVVLAVGGHLYDWQSGAISYDQAEGVLKIAPWSAKAPHMAANGEKTQVVLTATDLVGHALENK